MKIKMYVLCLLKFEDDTIVFDDTELDSINQAIGNCLQNFSISKSEKRDGWYVHNLNPKKLHIKTSSHIKINLVELGYYHHRVIVSFKLDLKKDFNKLREVRKELKQLADDIINNYVKKMINGLTSSTKVREKGKVRFFYTYPLIIVESGARNCESIPFSKQTGSMCFNIIEPSWFRPSGRRHMMRISIPSTILYTDGKANRNLLRDVINAIYQNCLYEKKLIDNKKGTFENLLNERLLIKLWQHILDTMGGRTIDVYIARITHITYFLALLAFIIAFIALIA